jgi:proteic killer suppression protein
VLRGWADKATEDVYEGANSKAARSIPRAAWGALRRKLDRLEAARELRDLSDPGLRREPLKGDQRGRYSLRVNLQYRITFRWEDADAYDVRCEDYHS